MAVTEEQEALNERFATIGARLQNLAREEGVDIFFVLVKPGQRQTYIGTFAATGDATTLAPRSTERIVSTAIGFFQKRMLPCWAAVLQAVANGSLAMSVYEIHGTTTEEDKQT